MEMKKVYQGHLAQVYEVAENVYFRKADLVMRGQCNGAYIVGDTGVAVVDAPPAADELFDEAREIWNKDIRYLFLTHGHGDHIDGLAAFMARELTIFCSRRLLGALQALEGERKATLVGVDGTSRVALPGLMEVELIVMRDTLHSPGDMFVRIPREGILCTGDAVVEYQTAYYHTADLGAWITSLDELAQKNDRLIFSGHADEPLPYAYIGDFAAFLGVVARAARACLHRYKAGEDAPLKDKYADISAQSASALVEDYFAEGGEEARYIAARTGQKDARREVRMALWSLIREYLR